MSEVFDYSFRRLVAVSASNSPTPGGGSVSAMVACLGTSMVAMVGNLTVGKEKYKDVEPQVQDILDKSYGILAKLEKLISADIAEFGKFMEVFKMPKNTDAEKAVREEKMQKALISATDTPLEIARTCLKALEIADALSTIGNKGAISDCGVGAYVAEAALYSALLSVDINLPSIKDQDYVNAVLAEKAQLVSKAKELKEKTIKVVEERMK